MGDYGSFAATSKKAVQIFLDVLQKKIQKKKFLNASLHLTQTQEKQKVYLFYCYLIKNHELALSITK